MPMFEITVDGQQHSGSFTTRADAERGLPAAQVQFPGKRVEVLERADGGDGLARYAGRDANGLPVTSVPNEVGNSGSSGQAPGSAQQPSEGMLPGPGGAVQTEGAAPAQPETKNPSMSPGRHK